MGYSQTGIYFTVDFAAIPETINGVNTFSPGGKPSGVRIYHDYADQKTLFYENWANSETIAETNGPNYPGLVHFYIGTDDIYLFRNHYSPALSDLDIKFDFYDENGRVYKVDCTDSEANTVTVPITGSITSHTESTEDVFVNCDLFEVRAIQTGALSSGPGGVCCDYRLEISVKNSFDNLFAAHHLLNDISGSYSISQSTDDGASWSDLSLNLSLDFEKGVIVSDEFEVCNPTDIIFSVDNGDFWQGCLKELSIEYMSDPSDCCSSVVIDFVPIHYSVWIPNYGLDLRPYYYISAYNKNLNCDTSWPAYTITYHDDSGNEIPLNGPPFFDLNQTPLLFSVPDCNTIRITVTAGDDTCVFEYDYDDFF